MATDKANRAGRITLSTTVKPAYRARKAGLFANGEMPVLLENTNQAQLTAMTPLTLLTKPYASSADIPSFPKDSRSNFFFLLKTPLMLERNDPDDSSDSKFDEIVGGSSSGASASRGRP
eukprot:CAMPEP_0172532290 /NCGR_PEP_ID=MMETSP1067-20121228/5403_1 /TAXON_ID=265564 ORGANISM="Thalassiosira punctigera, Strain Tpunct2005C2" /NCGR_SAMPLE_ID=MMETSP1067 /ASSEMBLY_ACC=CAM_ASM_000444 /LENGTH=118 /DNA_ID=CAMNT_0013316795 /DNA_START=365 /DNA_END=721 /DNA_ORIENTATION=+